MMDNDSKKNARLFLAELVLLKNYNFSTQIKCTIDNECIICCEFLKNTHVITTSCCHTFHRSCLLESIVEFDFDKCIECDKEYKFNKKESDALFEKLNFEQEVDDLVNELREIDFDNI